MSVNCISDFLFCLALKVTIVLYMCTAISYNRLIVNVCKLVFIDFCFTGKLVVIIGWILNILRLFRCTARWLYVVLPQQCAITPCSTCFLDLYKETGLKNELTSRSPQWNELYS